MESPVDSILRAISVFIRVLFCYADKSSELCSQLNLLIMKTYGLYLISALVLTGVLVSCETVDDDPQIHVDEENYVELSDVAQLFAVIPLLIAHTRACTDDMIISLWVPAPQEMLPSLFQRRMVVTFHSCICLQSSATASAHLGRAEVR